VIKQKKPTMHMRPAPTVSAILLLCAGSSQATKYIDVNAENLTCGVASPNPPWWPGDDGNPTLATGDVICGDTPQGSRFFQWTTVQSQASALNTTAVSPRPVSDVLGKTYHMAWFFRFARIGGLDVWAAANDQDSGDKGVEITGDGIRWDVSTGHGHWAGADSTAGHFTAWGGNPSYHLNPAIEVYDALPNNRSGYGINNSIQLDYERWYAAVMTLRIATDNTGYWAFRVNGTLVSEYDNIITAENMSSTFDRIQIGGTIAQPGYNAPPHRRQYDAFLFTDNWQDIIDGGYLGDPKSTQSPNAPANLIVVK
jgi:hypothetical protein